MSNVNMDSNLVSPSVSRDDNSYKEPGSFKKIIIPALIVILVFAVIAGAYFLGKSGNKAVDELSPTPTGPVNITEVSETDTPVPTSAGKLSGTITPTKKPTLTPKPTPTPTPIYKTKILSSDAALDGFRASNNGGNNSVEIRAGRNANLVERGFVSFNLADIPSGVTIVEATLRLYQGQIIGNPYGVGGAIKIDHLTYGDSLDSSDYGMAALSSSFTTLTSNATVEWKDANVTDRLKDDISNARSRSQYRIHYQVETTGGDVTGDFAYFESADNSMHTGNTPQLVVKYY